MCGASKDQKDISAQQQQMYKTLNDNYTTVFGQTQDILRSLTSTFTPILQAGPFQEGMTDAEKNALNTSQYENINSQYAAAQRATAQSMAARGGGNTLLPSSVGTNAYAVNANQAAQQRAAAANDTIQRSYALGRQNWNQAATILGNTASLLNPNAYSSSSTSAGSAAATTANQIAQANNSIWNSAIGALGSLGGAAIGNFSSLFPKTPSLPYQQYYNNPQPLISSAPSTAMIPPVALPTYGA